jgi:hypothetical protein
MELFCSYWLVFLLNIPFRLWQYNLSGQSTFLWERACQSIQALLSGHKKRDPPQGRGFFMLRDSRCNNVAGAI